MVILAVLSLPTSCIVLCVCFFVLFVCLFVCVLFVLFVCLFVVVFTHTHKLAPFVRVYFCRLRALRLRMRMRSKSLLSTTSPNSQMVCHS